MFQTVQQRLRPSLSVVLASISFTILFWTVLCVSAGRAIWFW